MGNRTSYVCGMCSNKDCKHYKDGKCLKCFKSFNNRENGRYICKCS